MTENWLPIAGYEGLYEVSDLGRIWSVPRPRTRGGIRRQVLSGEYLTVMLWRNNQPSLRYVHGIVAEAFLGPREPGQQVRHGRAGKLDNRAANLSYGTQAENEHDKVRDGTKASGDRHGQAKLSSAIVADCRVRYAAGARCRDLADEFGVHPVTMSVALRGKTWRDVPMAS